MATGNRALPDTIIVQYQRHRSGMICARSDNLEGLAVFGKSLEELEQDLPIVIREIILQRFGEDITYVVAENAEEFMPLGEGRFAREALAA